MIWTQEIIPEGWLECNGQSINPNYELYKTMKKTPNYQGMFLRGAGSQTITHGRYGSITHGTSLGEIQGDTIRNIRGQIEHPVAAPQTLFGVFSKGEKNQYPGWRHYMTGGYIEDSINFEIENVVPVSQENRPVNIGVKYIIKCD